jgi:hypothetical protein
VVLSHYSGGREHKTWWNNAPTPGGAFSALALGRQSLTT